MKKNKISFETNFWAGHEIENLFKVIDAFFNYAHLDYYKQTLTEVVFYSYKSKIYKEDNPAPIFFFYTSVRSFIKVCYCLKKKSKNWKVNESTPFKSKLYLASLSEEEFANPFIVFQKAFAKQTPLDFENFLCEVIHMSLCSGTVESDSDLIIHYIHLIKMFDSLQLIRERGLERLKNNVILQER